MSGSPLSRAGPGGPISRRGAAAGLTSVESGRILLRRLCVQLCEPTTSTRGKVQHSSAKDKNDCIFKRGKNCTTTELSCVYLTTDTESSRLPSGRSLPPRCTTTGRTSWPRRAGCMLCMLWAHWLHRYSGRPLLCVRQLHYVSLSAESREQN